MTAIPFTKFDPRAFLEKQKRRGPIANPAKAAKASKGGEPGPSVTLATLATLAGEAAQTQNLEASRTCRVVALADGEPDMEEPCAARRGRVQQLDCTFLHFCVECGRFAAFGYGVRLKTGQLGRWYCGEHRPPPAGSVLSNQSGPASST